MALILLSTVGVGRDIQSGGFSVFFKQECVPMETARVIELYQREQGYGIFQMNEYDVVAARDRGEAINWYLKDPDRPSDRLELEELGLDSPMNYVDDENSFIRSVTYRELIREAIRDRINFPCIIATFDWQQGGIE